jgi:NAD(P)-dependent dehydrogenase (short-subunit alcohol dehydrogenase family)
MCRQLVARGDGVIAACRQASKDLEALGCEIALGVDVTAPSAGATIVKALGDRTVDVLVNNAGVLTRDFVHRDGIPVSEGLAAIDFEAIRREIEVNTLGPLRLTMNLIGHLRPGSKIGFVSSRAGSIGDHPSGGLYGYRMSKAALNMAGANLARDLQGQGILVALLHPGFIRTEMTRGAGNDDPPVAARGLIARLDGLTPETSGHFLHANGGEVPW